MDEDFSNEPVSIAAIRAEKADDAALWSPRDALIAALREIDGKTKNISDLVVCYRYELSEKSCRVGFFQSAKDRLTAIGIISQVKHILLEEYTK